MANRDTPMGLRALRNHNGDNPPVKLYDAVTTVIFEGQVVLLNTAGLAVAVTATVASTIKNILGVAAAHKPLTTAAQIAAGASKVQVYDDPEQLYVAQSDDASLDSRTDYIGRNFSMVAPQSGNTTTLQSITEIDGSTGSSVTTSAAGRVLRIVDLFKQIGNAAVTGGTASSNADFIVRLNSRFMLNANSGNVGV